MDIKNPTPLHLAYVATLPCETVMSAKQALDDKLQGSVAAYLRCGGGVNNQIKLQVVSTKLSSSLRYDTIRDTILTCARKPT